jgi:hypothetical protein
MLEVKPGMPPVQAKMQYDVPDAIRRWMETVKQDVLDVQIEDVAEQSTSELRLNTPLKPMKKVS